MYNVIVSGVSPADENEKVNISVPVNCTVRLVRPRRGVSVRAYVSVDIVGVWVINNIEVHENRGEFEVVYPKQSYKRKNGEDAYFTLSHPSGNLGRTINHIILNEYSKAIVNRDFPSFNE